MHKRIFSLFLNFIPPLIFFLLCLSISFSSFAIELNLNFEKGGVSLFILVFLGGVLTSFTPCVLPMIPITLSLIGTNKTSSNYESFILSLFYVLGISTVYALLGLTAAATGSLFGSFLGQPLIKILFSLLLILLALSLFDWFEFKTPKLIQDKLQGYLSSHEKRVGIGLSFLSGGVSGLIASPCVGPVLASLLIYVSHSQNLSLGFFLLFTFSLGLGQLFLFLGLMSQRTFPQLGIWGKRLKHFLGLILILMALSFVLPFFKEKNLFSPFSFFSTKTTKTSTPHLKTEVVYGYQWVKFSKNHLKKAKQDGKPVILDFHADWCEACHKLENKTFNQPRVKELGKNFLWLKLDLSHPSEEKDHIAKSYEVLGLPTIVFYDSLGLWKKEITLRGFESEEDFLKRMKKALITKEDPNL